MIPELDAIKARAEAATESDLDAVNFPLDESYKFQRRSVRDVPRLVAALESVLELHQPYITRSAWQTCNECWNSGTAEIVYPCPTVAAIHGALEEEQPCTTN